MKCFLIWRKALRTHILHSGRLKNDLVEVDDAMFHGVKRPYQHIFWNWESKMDLDEVFWDGLIHCGPVTQICFYVLQLCKTDDANLRF
jgi:hypothetical protein